MGMFGTLDPNQMFPQMLPGPAANPTLPFGPQQQAVNPPPVAAQETYAQIKAREREEMMNQLGFDPADKAAQSRMEPMEYFEPRPSEDDNSPEAKAMKQQFYEAFARGAEQHRGDDLRTLVQWGLTLPHADNTVVHGYAREIMEKYAGARAKTELNMARQKRLRRTQLNDHLEEQLHMRKFGAEHPEAFGNTAYWAADGKGGFERKVPPMSKVETQDESNKLQIQSVLQAKQRDPGVVIFQKGDAQNLKLIAVQPSQADYIRSKGIYPEFDLTPYMTPTARAGTPGAVTKFNVTVNGVPKRVTEAEAQEAARRGMTVTRF
jgi:hypothetical protein